MSEFVESEAEEDSEEEVINKRRKRPFQDEEDDEEEEEDDEEKLREEMKDLINDDEEEDDEEGEGSGGSDVEVKKKKHYEDLDDALEDDDYQLIEENLGIKVQRKKKFKRLRLTEDDDESDREEPAEDEREAIANDLFEGSDEGEIRDERQADDDDQFKEMSGSELESDEDDFIVDDEGQPISKGKKRRHVRYTDAALQEAQDIFGVDFDYKDFEQYGDEYEEDIEEEEYEDEEEDGEARPRPKKHKQKRTTRKSIFDVFEPSELIRGHLTDLDNKIKATDVPERFQLRPVLVAVADDEEIEEEAQWIYKQAFCIPTLSVQGVASEQTEARQPVGGRKAPGAVAKIREALKFMRNQQLEVPFIAFYRKEYVEPDLNINDLWTVYKWDEKWCQLRSRKNNLQRLFEKMQNYQCDQVMKEPDRPLEENMRLLDDSDFEKLREVQTPEELRDCYRNFMLYYGQEVPLMQEVTKNKKQTQKDENAPAAEDDENAEPKKDDEVNELTHIKHGVRKDLYAVCREAGLDGLAKKFGLTPEQFGENLRDNYQRHEVDQYPVEPLEVAGDFTTKRFNKAEEALKVGRFMVATQIAREPLVRRVVRQIFLERAKIIVSPTRKGLKEIDENHPCYGMKYLKNKPVSDLVGDQFLKLTLAEDDGLLKIAFGVEKEGERQTFLDDIKQLYYKDEFSRNVQKWNEQRALAIDLALNKFLYPDLEKEMRTTLLLEAKDGIVKACSRKLYNWIRVAPYQVDQQIEEDEDYDTRDGLRILGVAYVPDRSIPAFCALIDGDGEMTDFLRLCHILCRKNAWKEEERELKEADMKSLRRFILAKKPHAIVVGGESREALAIVEDIRSVVAELSESEQMPTIGVELLDNELSGVYMNSKRAENDFRDYPGLLRQAVSLARRLQDPLFEFSQLCNYDEEILCIKYHPLQEQVSKDDLMAALQLEFVNRTNEVGVDLNRALDHPHTANLLQFVCGLGPRKSSQLLKMLKQNHQRLESRTQLVTVCKLGPQVFINCAGFIKIDTSSLGDSTDAYVEVLDGSRVHPEGYDWARKMAVDALEYDDMAEDVNPAGALEEILENPEKLKDLDLDAFAEELERQGFGNKSITLYDIRAELNHRYKDLRMVYRPCNSEEAFNMLTKETPETFYIGKLVLSTVVGIARRKPQGEQLDQANPNRTDDTGLWQCPFCLKNDFPELSEVWNHFDAGSCPGQAMGVRTRMDNGVAGFIPTKMISDKRVNDPEERVKVGMTVNCRITKINIEKFSVELTSRSSDLADKNGEWKPAKDLYFDYDAEEKDRKANEEQQKKQNRQTYIKRVIVHPAFRNIGFKEAEKLLVGMDQGEVIIRPSSKGVDHLTVTWKVYGNINQHIDVREEGKENAFSLGQSLWISNEEFEDLDEIIARYVQPMASGAREIVAFKYFRDAEGGSPQMLEKLLGEEKKKATSRIPYLLSVSREYPGKFLLYYMPRNKARHEFITVTPEGFRFRQHNFHTLNSLFKWFKEHFRDPIPGTPASIAARTPAGRNSTYIGATPSINLANVDPQAIQRAAASLPRHLFNTLSQVAGQTPGFNAGYGASQAAPYAYQPYTPSQPLATPLMTPSYHTVPTTPAATTPRYPPQTPQSGWQTPRPHTPRQTPRAQTPTRSSGNSRSSKPTAADWGMMAKQWAKKVQQAEEGVKGRSTPRTPQHHFPSPMVESTPAGDATPLIDEH